MGNVWEAMKKSQAEQERRAAEQPPADSGQPAAPTATSAERPSGVPAHAVGANGYAPWLLAHHDRGGMIAEQYRALRTQLVAQYPDERFSLVVTSAEGGEGKTVTCLNLSLILAERQERRTIVVDGDLRKGKVAACLCADTAPGLADLLRGKATPEQILRQTAYSNLWFIPAGETPKEEVGELIGRPELPELLGRLRRDYDYVLFDSPPVNALADASVLSRAVGEALVVVRMNKTHRESVDRAIRLLHAANVKISGLVLTHQKYFIPDYLYRYS